MAEKIIKTPYGEVGMSYVPETNMSVNTTVAKPTETTMANTDISNISSQQMTDFANKYKAITTQQLQTPAPVIPQTTQTNPYVGTSQYNKAITSTLTPPTYTPPPAKSAADVYAEGIAGLGQAPSQVDLQNELNKQFDIEQKTQTANALKSQIEAINAQEQVALRTLESQSAGKDVTSQFLGRQQQEISRQAAIRSLPLTAQYQAALGDLQGAQNTVTKLFTAKLADAQNQYENKKEIAKVAYQYATDKEKEQIRAKEIEADREYEKTKTALAFEQEKELLKYKQQLEGNGTATLDTSWQDIGGERVLVNNQTGEIISKSTGDKALADLEFAKQRGADKVEQLTNLIDNKTGINASSGLWRGTSLVNKSKVNDWRADVNNVLSRLTVDELGRVKADGVTFGALSDPERKAVGDAASALNAGMILKDGLPTGRFKLSEAKVKKELETIKKYAELDFERRTGQKYSDFKAKATLSSEDLNEINSAYGINSTSATFNPANFY